MGQPNDGSGNVYRLKRQRGHVHGKNAWRRTHSRYWLWWREAGLTYRGAVLASVHLHRPRPHQMYVPGRTISRKKTRKLKPYKCFMFFFQVFFFSHDGTDGTTHRCSDSRRIFPRHRQAHGARRRRPGVLLGWGEALKKPAGRSRHLCGRAGRWRARGGQKQPKKRRKRPRRQIRGLTRKSQRPPTANTTPGPAPTARTPKK